MRETMVAGYSDEPADWLEPPPSGISLASLAVVLVSTLVPALITFVSDLDGPTPGPTIGLILLGAGVVLPLAGLGALTELYLVRKRWIADMRFRAFRLARSRGESSVQSLRNVEDALFKAGAYDDALAVADLREVFEPPPRRDDDDDDEATSGTKEPVPRW